MQKQNDNLSDPKQQLNSNEHANLRQIGIHGCLELKSQVFQDPRGMFVKTYSLSNFVKWGLDTSFVEAFYTVSGDRVLRGMHFQLPPADHAKLVYCITGAIMDVALDLRLDSSTYQQHAIVNLSSETKNALYLPRGIAHGFYVVRAPATVMYHVTVEHIPSLDSGVAWNSFGVDWPDKDPVISERDAGFGRMDEFISPFRINRLQEQL